MAKLLYLDTARLGRMSPGAQQAHQDFVRFAGDEGCPLYFEDFLRVGAQGCPQFPTERYPTLAQWPGIAGLKQQLRFLGDNRSDMPLLLANRSAQLMKLSTRLLFGPCENVLVTDLGWPAYRSILEEERLRTGRIVTTARVREAILREQASAEQIVAEVCAEFLKSGCDGLFLTAVSHDGIRLPVPEIVHAIQRHRQPRFVVVDGAQEFCHVPSRLRTEFCDLYLAGCHKWLCGYHPMGLGFYGWRRSVSFIETSLHEMLDFRDLDDPLLRFSAQLESGKLNGETETVNLGSLFSAFGAANDAMIAKESSHQQRLRNRGTVGDAVAGTPWEVREMADDFESGIAVLRAKGAACRDADVTKVREAFQRQGVSLTAYDGGLIRLSMPPTPLTAEDVAVIRRALSQVV